MIRVVVAHSNPVSRAGIATILRSSAYCDVVGQTGHDHEAVELARRHRPEVIVVEMSIGGLDGLAITRTVRREVPGTRIVIHAPAATEHSVHRAFSAGATGFLVDGGKPREIVGAVLVGAAGGFALSPSAASCVMERFQHFDPSRIDGARGRLQGLTRRERGVLACLVQGMGNTEIGGELAISEGTVKAHVSHLMIKLGCTNRVQAAIIAHDSGLFPYRAEATAIAPVAGQLWIDLDTEAVR